MTNTVVNITNLKKKIKNTTILENINLKVESGQIIGIVGRNGSGKSMLFKTIVGLIKPNEGSIKVFNKEILNDHLPSETGVLLDSTGFLPNYTGFQNLKLLASINNLISVEEIKNSISLVGLNPEEKKPVRKYSLGMKQRLGIAQAIMEKPKLLILDEPMNGLDQEGVQDIRNLILEYKKRDITIVIASHNSEDIKILCDSVYKMDNGRLTQIN